MKALTATEVSAAGRPASSDRLRTLLDFRYLALAAVLATYALIVLGGAVRVTDSGTACPDWPLCYGQVVPPLETKVMIEYSHRLAASAVGLLILATVVWGWLRQRENKLVVWGGGLAVVLLAVQVIVGGVTVGTETAASVVALHLSIALALLATLVFTTAGAFLGRRANVSGATTHGMTGFARPLPVLGLSSVGATFALIIVGAYVSQTGAGLAYPDWPLFNGKLVSAGGRLAELHYAHRLLAAVVGVLLASLAFRTLRRDRQPAILVAVGAASALYVTQVIVGAGNIWLHLATSVRIAHLALASALWGALVFALAWSCLSSARPSGRSR